MEHVLSAARASYGGQAVQICSSAGGFGAARRSCRRCQLREVVRGAEEGPFGGHFLDAAQQELSEASSLLDLAEYGFDDLLSQPVATSPSRPPELEAHRLGEAAAPVSLVLAGML